MITIYELNMELEKLHHAYKTKNQTEAHKILHALVEELEEQTYLVGMLLLLNALRWSYLT